MLPDSESWHTVTHLTLYSPTGNDELGYCRCGLKCVFLVVQGTASMVPLVVLGLHTGSVACDLELPRCARNVPLSQDTT